MARSYSLVIFLLVLVLTAHAQQTTSFPAAFEGPDIMSLGWNGSEVLVGQHYPGTDMLIWRLTSTATARRAVFNGKTLDSLRVGRDGEFLITSFKENRVWKIANQKAVDLATGTITSPAVSGDGNLVYQVASSGNTRGGVYRNRNRIAEQPVDLVWGYQGETYGISGRAIGRVVDGLFQPVGGLEINPEFRPEFLYDPTSGEVAVFQRERGTVWSLSTGKLLASIPQDAIVSETFSKVFLPYRTQSGIYNGFGNEPIVEATDLNKGEDLEIPGGIYHAPAAVYGNSLVVVVYRGQWPVRYLIVRKDEK